MNQVYFIMLEGLAFVLLDMLLHMPGRHRSPGPKKGPAL